MKWIIGKIKGIGSWIAHLPLVAKIILAVVLVAVLFGGSFGSYKMYDYTQNDPVSYTHLTLPTNREV